MIDLARLAAGCPAPAVAISVFDRTSVRAELGGPSPGPGSYGASGFVGNRLWLEPARGYGVLILSNRIHPHRTGRAPFAAWCDRLLAAVGGR